MRGGVTSTLTWIRQFLGMASDGVEFVSGTQPAPTTACYTSIVEYMNAATERGEGGGKTKLSTTMQLQLLYKCSAAVYTSSIIGPKCDTLLRRQKAQNT